MFKSLAVAFAVIGFAAAQDSSNFAPGYTQSCQAYYDQCSQLSGRCTPGLDDCTAKCQTAYDTCRTTRDSSGLSANQAQCASNFATCLGKNPFASNGTNTATRTASSSSVSVTQPASPSSTAACQDKYDTCRTTRDPSGASPNQSLCASQFAQCLGTNPFASNGTNTVTRGAPGVDAVVTQVVTAYTTYCPSATTFAVNNVTYTATTATTLTITNCPCTVVTGKLQTTPPPSAPTTTAPAGTGALVTQTTGKTTGTAATSSKPVQYTGAADSVKPMAAIAAIGLLAYL